MANNRVLVTDRGLRAVVAVDRNTGDRAIMYAAGTGAGPALIAPVSLELYDN